MNYHKKMSYTKSGLRIVGFFFLGVNISIASILLIIAEVLGILEERDE